MLEVTNLFSTKIKNLSVYLKILPPLQSLYEVWSEVQVE